MGVICEICIDKPRRGHYKTCSLLKGVVKYVIDEPTEYENVTLSLRGRAKAKWTAFCSLDADIFNTGKQDLITRKLNVIKIAPDETVTLHGAYEYPFEFYLPQNLPTSYKDKTVKITYRIKMKFQTPCLFNSSEVFAEEFLVLGSVDPTPTDGERFYKGPVIFGLEKKLFAPFAKKPLVKLKAEIAKSWLIPGEEIQLSYMVTKPPDVAIDSVITDLYCNTTYTGATVNETKKKVERVCTGETVGVLEREVGHLTCVVPTLPEMFSMQNCRLVSKEYRVRVTLRLPRPHRNAVVEIPVVLGYRKTIDPELLAYLNSLLDQAPFPTAPRLPVLCAAEMILNSMFK